MSDQRYDFRTQRLFVDANLSDGKILEVERAQANYLLNVLRMKAGGAVLLFNGRDGEWLASVQPEGRKKCTLVLEEQTRPQPPPYDLVYCFAPLKQARLDYMIQKAVEMGAGTLQPVLTHHTQVTKLNLERIQSNAIEAAEQCGILNIPKIEAPLRFGAMMESWDVGRALIFCDEAAEHATPWSALETLAGHAIAVLIGPEGGFSEEERGELLAKPFVTAISLGPRILRADTAAVAALAVVQAAIGDWEKQS